MGGAGDAAERDGIVGIALAADLALGEFDVVGKRIELLRRDPAELVADLVRRHMGCHRGARRKPARIRACGDRPLVLCRIHFECDIHVVRLKTELLGDDLGEHGLMPLALHVTSAVTETAPSGSTLTVTIDTAPFFGPAFSRASAVSKFDRSPMFDMPGSTMAAKPMP